MPANKETVFPKRLFLSLSLAPCFVSVWTPAWAVCNGGTTVTGTLTISASCDGSGVKPLTLDTGAAVTINSGVTVSNDAFSGRNGDPVSVASTATSSSLTNNGTISTAQQWGVTVNGTLTSLINTGTISSGTRRGVVLATGGVITTLTNTGTISGPFAGVTNSGTVLTTFNNLQGAGNGSGAVTYAGAMPTNYNIIINSPTVYGKLTGVGVTGSTAFGIYGTSTVAAGTYASVLSGIDASNLSVTSGTFGSYNWLLSLASGSTTIWDLAFTLAASNMNAGGTYALSAVGSTVNPVFNGGTLTTTSGASSNQAFTLNTGGGTITSPTGGTATLSGVLSGAGALTVNGTGTLVLSGANTYSGGTTLSSGTLTFSGNSAFGTGAIFVSAGSTLMGTGTISGPLTVAGTFKPGNSPGYVASGNVTMNSGSTYQQDIAGTAQAGASSPVGASGYYSFLNASGQVVIQPNATLTPRLSNLFTAGESGFGSIPYTPVLGDRFRIMTAGGGISGRFSTLTQPAELAAGTQFVQFYNVSGSNSLDLAVIPTSYATTLAAQNGNARAAAGALDRIVSANQAGSTTAAQDQLLYAASGQSAANLASFSRALAGEVHAANLAVVPQATLRLQQAVMARLARASDAADAAPASSNFRHTGALSASGASQPGTSSGAGEAGCGALTPSSTWGDITYQRGRRSADANAGDFSSDMYQMVFGADACVHDRALVGGGIALSRTEVNGYQGTGTVQHGSLFAYGQLPVDAFVVDGLMSYGRHATDASRTDPTGFTSALQSTRPRGNDTLISAGLSRSFDMANRRITPYGRLSWQHVTQSSFDEGTSAAALSVNSFSASGARATIGVTASSKAQDPRTETWRYHFDLAAGVDTSNLLNPTLGASLAGASTSIATPGAGSGFVQAGYYGQVKLAKNAFAYLGLAVEARSHAALGNMSLGARILF